MKKIIILISLVFVFTSCSRIIDAVWNPDTASFELKAVQASSGSSTINLSFTKTDHYNTRGNSNPNSEKYFWGYYIYRNNISPYDDYTLVGIEAQEVLGGSDTTYSQTYHSSFKFMPGGAADNNLTDNRTFTDTVPGCTAVGKQRYFYRVVAVYRDWDTSAHIWKSTTTDEDKSSFAIIECY